jgi:diguanylate cyclase (GGDEF)-like protein
MGSEFATLLRWSARAAVLGCALIVAACLPVPANDDNRGFSLQLVDVDATAAQAPALEALGHGVALRPMPRSLPYAEHGSWVAVRVDALPPEPRLVVEGQVAGPVTLLLPDGTRRTRNKLAPEADDSASPVALVFPLPADLPPGSVLRLHLAHRHLALTQVRLLSSRQWFKREQRVLVIATLLYTALGCFALVALCFWVVVRDRMYAEYTVFLLSWLAFMASNSGLLYTLPGHELMARGGIHFQWLLVSVCFAMSIAFARDFIDVGRNAPRLKPVYDAGMWVFLAAAALVAFTPWQLIWYGMAMSAVTLTVYPAMVAAGAWIALRTGDRYAWYFLIGWIPMTLGSMVRGLQTAGLIHVDSAATHLYALGVLMQASALVLGLADRMLRTRRERDVARHAADHDALTGALNRRALDAHLARLSAACRNGGPPLAMLFLDIDHFKRVNDTYGHDAGDACLREAARRIGVELRAGDLLGRWGGEEFVVLLPGAGIEDARRVAEAIRQSLAARPVPFHGRAIALTLSAGIAAFDPSTDDATTLAARADAALYRAKESGRDRVEAIVRTAA